MTRLAELGAAEMIAGYRSGEFSPLDVAGDAIAQVERWEPTIAATWAFDAGAAIEQATASTERWRRREPCGALDGVPVTIKENIATRGVPVPLGSAATELVPAADDAPPAARLREAGAVMLAKTTMPDFGMLSSGLSSFHALSRNPWDPSKGPGGSSAGAAAAAAAGYGPLHLGTDIGGSIRLPAGWCGVVGFKPSGGRVPIKPPYLGRVAGPITRSVADTALLMATIARTDWRDATALPAQDIDWTVGTVDPTTLLRGLKVGVLLDAGWGLPLDDDIAGVVRSAARSFEEAGATVEPVAAFTTRAMADGINLFWRVRSWLDISALTPERRDRVLPYIRGWAAAGETCSTADLFNGYSQFAALRDAAVAACQPFDIVISPVAPVSAFPAEWASPTNDPLRAMEHIAYTLPFNMSEQPAISVPAGHTAAGLPIGLQIVGRRHDDAGVLRAARAWEILRAPLRPWPQPAA